MEDGTNVVVAPVAEINRILGEFNAQAEQSRIVIASLYKKHDEWLKIASKNEERLDRMEKKLEDATSLEFIINLLKNSLKICKGKSTSAKDELTGVTEAIKEFRKKVNQIAAVDRDIVEQGMDISHTRIQDLVNDLRDYVNNFDENSANLQCAKLREEITKYDKKIMILEVLLSCVLL